MTGIERLEFLADVLADNGKYGAVAANLREIAAQITAELTDREGYESDVLAWVEEHGGLGRVSAAHERQKRHIDRVERWSAARAGRLKRHIATLEQALTRRNRRIRELEAQRDKSDLTHRAPVLAADGEPLEEGQTVYGVGSGEEFEIVNIRDGMPLLKCRGGEAKYTATEPEYLTHARPVLAADGEPLEVGQTVRTVDAGIKFEVHSIEGDTVWGSFDGDCADDGLDPKSLTHQRPILAADGKPLREGETVWDIETGREYVVIEPSYGKTVVVLLAKYDDAEGEQHAPDQFTHTKPKPDSWSSVWADVSNGCETPQGMEHRCKTLAERGGDGC